MRDSRTPENRLGHRLPAIAFLIYAVAIAGYFVLRYKGHWLDGDTARITQATEVILAKGAIVVSGPAYQHGFGYQAVAVALSSASGLTIQALQTEVFPFVATLGLGLAALAFFAQVTRDRYTAVLAALFLFFQPDLLYVTLRGSHEKLGWPLMMIALMLFCQSVGRPQQTMAVYVGLFYVTIFAMVTINVFFASTFLASIILSLVIGWAVIAFRKRGERGGPLLPIELRRLVYVSASCGILIFVFIAYIYPLAGRNLRLLSTIADQIAALLLSFETQSHPYDYIQTGWVSSQVYLGLTAFTWLLISASFVEWLWRGKRLLSGQESLDLRTSLDWLLYAGFAVQVAASVVVDFAGVLSANMQLRLFPAFTVLAAGLLAGGIRRIVPLLQIHHHAWRILLPLAGLAVAWFGVATLLKASNEPILSNKWSFYSPSESAALSWTDQHLRYANIWTGFDERFSVIFDFNYGYDSSSGNVYSALSLKPQGGYVFFSESERLRGLRLKQAMPSIADWNRVYDNGATQLYHLRSQTPYQP